jgi:hypothetical protein
VPGNTGGSAHDFGGSGDHWLAHPRTLAVRPAWDKIG